MTLCFQQSELRNEFGKFLVENVKFVSGGILQVTVIGEYVDGKNIVKVSPEHLMLVGGTFMLTPVKEKELNTKKEEEFSENDVEYTVVREYLAKPEFLR